jgi:hypothetical protein
MEEGADPVHLLRIRIPPFQEIEEDLVFPPWPKKSTPEADGDYLDLLFDIIDCRKKLRDRVYGASEVMKYLYNRPALCEHDLGYAQTMVNYINEYMALAGDIEYHPDDETTRREYISRIKNRITYYGRRLRRFIEDLPGY